MKVGIWRGKIQRFRKWIYKHVPDFIWNRFIDEEIERRKKELEGDE